MSIKNVFKLCIEELGFKPMTSISVCAMQVLCISNSEILQQCLYLLIWKNVNLMNLKA